MYDTTATLLSETIAQDAYLNEIKTYQGRDIFVRRTRSIYRDEFYQAAAVGLRPAAVLVIFAGDYTGEKLVEWQGITYAVTRTYQAPGSDDLELTISERLGDREEGNG